MYRKFKQVAGAECEIHVNGPLSIRPDKLYLAIIPAEKKKTVLVKLVLDGLSYSAEVHQKAALAGYAPEYFGGCELPGAPPAHVMEYLQPPADNSDFGWLPLSTFLKKPLLHPSYHAKLRTALLQLVSFLETGGMVHGDFRPNNVMVRTTRTGQLDDQPKLRLIDFDWAGPAGVAQYPVVRNEDIPWPGAAGSNIEAGHDRIMLHNRDVWAILAEDRMD